jgi:hypothetical protein
MTSDEQARDGGRWAVVSRNGVVWHRVRSKQQARRLTRLAGDRLFRWSRSRIRHWLVAP